MPIFKYEKDIVPSWCEVEEFEFIDVYADKDMTIERHGEKEAFVVCRGKVIIEAGGVSAKLLEGSTFEIKDADIDKVSLRGCSPQGYVCRVIGHWKAITSSGVFTVKITEPPLNDTPYDYEKTTGFDNHYHDCDEYWFVFQGKGKAVSDGKFYNVGSGDCIATGMGWHHDVASVEVGGMKAVWFEGTLEGQKRTGHLWEPEHGKAQPKKERV
jgi:mannose-6-phosphate isomerase-like protein (cupin superfamily)